MKIFRSFRFAFIGITHGLEEHNMRIHLLVTTLVVCLGFYFSISLMEWVAIILSIGLVITAELFNTALEEVCDLMTAAHPASYKKAGKPKDISAGAVLVAATVAKVVGLIIFVPYFMTLFAR